MRALLKKELRALLPLFGLGVLLFSGDLVARPFYQRLDELSWLEVSETEAQNTGIGLMLALLAIAMAFSALPREHDDRTIEQLYALPVARSTIFAAKALAGLLALAGVVVLGESTNALLISQNHQTFSGEQWRLTLVWKMVLLEVATSTSFYAYAILASWLRRFGIALLALLALVLFKLQDQRPSLRALNPLHLLDYRYHGKELVLPWRELAFSSRSRRCYLAAQAGCGCATPKASATGFRQPSRQRSRWLLRAGAALAFGLGLAAFGGALGGGDLGVPRSNLVEISLGVAEAKSQYFTFTYPEGMRERSLALIAGADDEWRFVKGILHARDYPGLVIDLADHSGEHDGVAAWSKARVSLTRLEDPEYARFVLVHELVHIAQQRESGRRLMENAASTGFFSEGMAQFVAHLRVSQSERQRYERSLASETLARQHIPFEVLADHTRLRALVPPTADYLLGELWTEALVAQCGLDAPGRVLKAFARPDAAVGLSGRALWSDTLQAMQCDLEGVLASQARIVETLRNQEAELLASIPRLSGGLAENKSDQKIAVLVARADRPLPEGAKVVLTLRDDSLVSDDKYQFLESTQLPDAPESYEFKVPYWRFAGERFQFAFGVKLMAEVYPVFEPFHDVRFTR